MINDIELKYSVGALLYTPALNVKIADSVISGKLGEQYSLALCLEDTVGDDMVETAEKQVYESLKKIASAQKLQPFYLPKIFIRVRRPAQLLCCWERLREFSQILTGFILPKYTTDNADAYNQALTEVNAQSQKKIWMMPIMESADIVEPATRAEILGAIREKIRSVDDLVLNVRVGGNDFSNQFSVRRHYDETIYDILPIAQLMGDILSYFSRDYIVSGPVWEFFSSDNDEWKNGLRRELKLDRLNGFIGKTVIHPKQIPVVNEMLRVTNKDYEDAKNILHWDQNGLQVGKSFGGERMNEVRTHYNWAKRILLLSEIYGIN